MNEHQKATFETNLLHPEEAAVFLGIRRTRLYRLLAEGEIPYVMVDGRKRVPLDALRRWIAEKTVVSSRWRNPNDD